MSSRPPHPHKQKQSTIIMRHLPPHMVSRPLRAYARSRSQYAQHLVGLFAIVALLFWTSYAIISTHTGAATVGTRVNITESATNICYFTLYPGDNYVSFNCISTGQDRDELFALTDVSQFYAVWDYEPLGGDRWKVYAPHLPSWVHNDLTTLSRKNGYIIRLNGSSTIVNYTGFITETTTIPVYKGYNLVGYPSNIVDKTPLALTTINTTFTHIYTYNHTAGYVVYYEGSGGNLTNLMPHEGYWLNLSTTDSWVVYKNRTG